MSTIPEWFWEAVDQKPASHYTEIDDIDLHYLSWNERQAAEGFYLSTGTTPTRIGGILLRRLFAISITQSRWI